MMDHLQIRLECDAIPEGTLEIARLEGTEAISRLFAIDLLVVSKDSSGLDGEELIGRDAALVFERSGDEVRRIFGMISLFNDRIDTETEHSSYRLVFSPRAFRLTLVEMLDVFLDLSVPDILRQKLRNVGLEEGDDFEMRLYEKYPVREFVVQYKETDLAFISRLCEHLGICFFFEHRGGRDVMVFTDLNSGFRPIADDPTIAFRARGEKRDVFQLEETIKIIPSLYVVRDYNYRTPQLTLTGEVSVPRGMGGVVEYGAHVKTPEEAERVALIRSQERLASRRVFQGASDLPALRHGVTLTLEGHPYGDLELLVTEVAHRASQVVLHGAAPGGTLGYENAITAIKKSRQYRPPRVTPKPRISGVVNGIVESSEKGQYAELDDEGRYRVRFLFDTTTTPGEAQASRPVRMAQPHSGAGYGMHFPLRHGVEVIITFVDGDPDRPIIAATVPNPQTSSPVTGDNAPRNIIRTGSGNEINIDDTEDSERIKLTTPHSSTTFQLGAPNSPERGAMLETQGASSTVATSGVAGFTNIKSTIAAINEFRAAGNITTVAEKPGAVAVVEGITGIMSGILDIASAAIDATMAARAAWLSTLKQAAVETQVAARDADVELKAKRKAARGKGAALKAKLSETDDAALLAAMAEYESALATYETDQLGLRTNQEWLRDALKGVQPGLYTGVAETNRLAVEASLKSLNGDPEGETEDAMKGSKKILDEKRAAYEAALAAYKAAHPDTEASELAAACEDALEEEKASDDKHRDKWEKWNDPENPMRKFDEASNEAEFGEQALTLKQTKLAIDHAKTALAAGALLFSVVMQLVAAVKALYHWYKNKQITAKAFVTAIKSFPRAVVAPFKPHLIVHTLGSTGNTELYADQGLLMRGESVLVKAENTTVMAEDHLSFLSAKKAELATGEQLRLTSELGPIDMKANELKAVAANGIDVESTLNDILLAAKAGNIEIKAPMRGKKIAMEARGEISGRTDEVKLNAKVAAEILSGQWFLKVEGKKRGVMLGSSTWSLSIKQNDVKLGSAQNGLRVKDNSTSIQTGPSTSVIALRSQLKLTSTSVKINGTGSVEIKANGQVKLG